MVQGRPARGRHRTREVLPVHRFPRRLLLRHQAIGVHGPGRVEVRRQQRLRPLGDLLLPEAVHTQALPQAEVPRVPPGGSVGRGRRQPGVQSYRGAPARAQVVQGRGGAEAGGYTQDYFWRGRI